MSTAPYESRHTQLTKTVKRLGVNKHVIKTLAIKNQQVSALLLQNKSATQITHSKLRRPSGSLFTLYNFTFLTSSTMEVDWVAFNYKYEKGYFIFVDGSLYEIKSLLFDNDKILFINFMHEYEKDELHVALRLKQKYTVKVINFELINECKPYEKVLSKRDSKYYVQVM